MTIKSSKWVGHDQVFWSSSVMQHTLMRFLNLSKLLEKVQDQTKIKHTIDDLQAFRSTDSEYILLSTNTLYFTSYIRHKVVSGLSVWQESLVYTFLTDPV